MQALQVGFALYGRASSRAGSHFEMHSPVGASLLAKTA